MTCHVIYITYPRVWSIPRKVEPRQGCDDMSCDLHYISTSLITSLVMAWGHVNRGFPLKVWQLVCYNKCLYHGNIAFLQRKTSYYYCNVEMTVIKLQVVFYLAGASL